MYFEKYFDTTSEELAIKQSLARLLSTTKGSVFFDRDYGIGLENYIGKPMVESTVGTIEFLLKGSLEKQEPRIKLDTGSVKVTTTAESSTLNVSFSYTVKSSGSRNTFVGTIGAQ